MKKRMGSRMTTSPREPLTPVFSHFLFFRNVPPGKEIGIVGNGCSLGLKTANTLKLSPVKCKSL